MGTPVPPPAGSYPVGIDCPPCTPALYASGAWPLHMYATFHDIIASPGYPPAPNNYTFKLTQGAIACTWGADVTLSGSTWTVMLTLSWSYIWLYRASPPAGYYFYCDLAPCTLYFPFNTNIDPPDAGTGGRAIVRPTPAALPSLLTGPYGFMPWNPTMFEQQSVAMDHELVRLANKSDHSCCYFYIDREDLPAP